MRVFVLSLLSLGMAGFLSLAHAQDPQSKYTIGPGDAIEIDVSKHPEFSGTYHVGQDGKIQYTYVGDIDVTGLNKEQLEEKIKTSIAKYVVSPEINVIITQFQSKNVYILGEVARPGRYSIQSETITVKEAVMLAGLPKQTAALHRVLIFTAGTDKKSVKEVDLFALLYQGDTSQNMVLSSGDTLYVPDAIKVYYVLGEVLKPGKYNMSSESISVKEALMLSGLPTKAAALNKAKILRKDKTTQEINLYTLLYSTEVKEEVLLYPGDSLYVPALVSEIQESKNKISRNFDALKYTLGPDDVIDINVAGHPEFSGVYPISLEGKVQYKFVGDIKVTGMTKGQLEDKLKNIISAYVSAPEVSVTITEFKSKAIYIVGEVANPGKYFMRSDTITVTEAVMLAGLPTTGAAMRKTQIITPGVYARVIRHVNLYALLYQGNLSENLVLKPGDYLYVPSTVLTKLLRIILPVSNTINSASAPLTVAAVVK
ncbi:MAG: polysaccharide biosynthesis/export family protein [Candidatus Omnitrophica bacterium]|nr:polysaccharide biosynthesis/export family protein [Candidatus Omnitrophota bacterium]